MKLIAKFTALLLWLAFLLGGAWKIGHRQNTPPASSGERVSDCLTPVKKKTMSHLFARHDMGVNWRVRKSDLYQPAEPGVPAASDFDGKYVVCKLHAGDAMVPSEVRFRPEVSPATGKILYLLPLQRGEEEWLNAGKHVDLFPGPTALVSNAEVMAVICDSNCDAVLQLAPAEIELLKQTNPLKLKKVSR
jgi:hypothetical protein